MDESVLTRSGAVWGGRFSYFKGVGTQMRQQNEQDLLKAEVNLSVKT